jgi:hypothetical protein
VFGWFHCLAGNFLIIRWVILNYKIFELNFVKKAVGRVIHTCTSTGTVRFSHCKVKNLSPYDKSSNIECKQIIISQLPHGEILKCNGQKWAANLGDFFPIKANFRYLRELQKVVKLSIFCEIWQKYDFFLFWVGNLVFTAQCTGTCQW